MDASIDQRALKALIERSDTRGFGRFVGHLALLALTGTLVLTAGNPLLLGSAMVLHGMVLAFLFCAEHECIHRTAFKTRFLNDAVAWICGLLICLPPRYFRAFHFAHHRHTQDPALDPELAVPKPRDLGGYLRQVSGLPYWWERFGTTLRHAFGRVDETFVRASHKQAIRTEARVFCGVYLALATVSVLAGNALLLLCWVMPALLGQPFLRLLLMAEHTNCPTVPDMLRNSRTTRTLWPLCWLTWNMPFHAEHHAFPAVPFHALPEAHRLVAARLPSVSNGYIAVHRGFIANLTPKRHR